MAEVIYLPPRCDAVSDLSLKAGLKRLIMLINETKPEEEGGRHGKSISASND